MFLLELAAKKSMFIAFISTGMAAKPLMESTIKLRPWVLQIAPTAEISFNKPVVVSWWIMAKWVNPLVFLMVSSKAFKSIGSIEDDSKTTVGIL